MNPERIDQETNREEPPARPLRRRDARAVWDLHFGPNMTPMADVTLVILIFFMASTAFIAPEWVLELRAREVDRRASGAEPASVEPASSLLPGGVFEITIEPDGQGTIRLRGLGIETDSFETMAQTAAEVAAGTAQAVFHLRPAPTTPYQAVLQAHEALHAVGAQVQVGDGA